MDVCPCICKCARVSVYVRFAILRYQGTAILYTGYFTQTVFLKKRRFSACFYHGKCGKAATCSLDTPILGEECEDLLSLTILACFDTISSHENGIFTNQKNFANLWHISQIDVG